jgi:hypothetical protein
MEAAVETPFRAPAGKHHAMELRAMNQIARILDGLPDPARVRVMTWVQSRENEVVTQWDDKSPEAKE